jgi:hypothetical protein
LIVHNNEKKVKEVRSSPIRMSKLAESRRKAAENNVKKIKQTNKGIVVQNT